MSCSFSTFWPPSPLVTYFIYKSLFTMSGFFDPPSVPLNVWRYLCPVPNRKSKHSTNSNEFNSLTSLPISNQACLHPGTISKVFLVPFGPIGSICYLSLLTCCWYNFKLKPSFSIVAISQSSICFCYQIIFLFIMSKSWIWN